jgi:putative transposase
MIVWIVRAGTEGAVGAEASLYKGFRFPAEIISHAVWLYHRFPLSYREVELLLLARGVIVSYETVRKWCAKFGPEYARRLRRRRPQTGDKWHLDEVFIKISGVRHYLWRAVDQHGNVLDILVQAKRDGKAARRFLAKLMKKQCPRRSRSRSTHSRRVARLTPRSAAMLL